MTTVLRFKDAETLRVAAVSPLVFGYATDGIRLPDGHAHDNLHASLRAAALEHFSDKQIGWWRRKQSDSGQPPGPTGLLRSSQVACINHLMPARLDAELALAVARSVVPDATEALQVDGGYVAFEWIGEKADIGETGAKTRGSHRTNLDAVLIVRRPDGRRTGLVIEWKHTEAYGTASKAFSRGGTNRVSIYKDRILDPASPINRQHVDKLADLFYDPFEQLLRQALLAWRLALDDDLFDDWLHLHVIPAANRELIDHVTAPNLAGASMPEAFASTLKHPNTYRHVTPTRLLSQLSAAAGPTGWRAWLAGRYAT